MMGCRVSCRRCEAHRDLLLQMICLVCGSGQYDPVPPTIGDRDVAMAAVLAAAEAVDVVLFDDGSIGALHPAAIQLAAACRELARTRHRA